MSDGEDDKPDLRSGIPVADLPEGGMRAGTFDGEPVVLVNTGGKICALAGQCTHHGAPLETGLLIDGQIRCPWHHARFAPETGEAVAAPALAPLDSFEVEQHKGKLFVTGKTTRAEPPPAPAESRIVIVGGGAAGHACADMLVRGGFGASVTVISDDADAPYDRTQCSKEYLAGTAKREDTPLATADFYGKGGPVMRLKQRAQSLDLGAKTILLENGETVAFDSLVLATGAEPVRPDLPGFDRANVFVLRTLRDADALIAAAKKDKKAVIVGGSFIGLEVAASLIQRKVKVDVVVSDAVPLAKIVGPEVGKMILAVHQDKGATFHLGCRAASFDGHVLTLDDGSELEADFVVLGAGVKPRTDLAECAGLRVASKDQGGGVIVDAHLQTSMHDVYAIGDIARYPDRSAGKELRIEHWVHAERQGQHVARVLMGETAGFGDLPFFWSAHFDTGLLHSGHTGKIAKTAIDGSIADQAFVARYSDDTGEHAVVTCNRDHDALTIEAGWEKSRAG